MRYELSDYEWTAIKPMLPNKPRGVRRVNDRRKEHWRTFHRNEIAKTLSASVRNCIARGT
jgi:transposase